MKREILMDVRFTDGGPVDLDRTGGITAFNGVTGHPDDPFDQVLGVARANAGQFTKPAHAAAQEAPVRRGPPAGRFAEDNHVPAFRR